MKKYNRVKRLAQYTASAAAFLLINEAGATVVYTDVDPDIVIGGEGAEVSIDINLDGDDDFTFSVYNYAGSLTYYGLLVTFEVNRVSGEAINNNEFFGSVVSYSGYTNIYIHKLTPGEGINDEDNFEQGTGSMAVNVAVSVSGFPYYNIESGQWLDSDMEFLGFRLHIDADYYYGWMRVSVNADATQITIHDYAYENEANKSIFAGMTATDIVSNNLVGVNVYSYNQTLYINQTDVQQGELNVGIYDLEGKLVFSENNITGAIAINCAQLANGNYVTKIEGKTGSLNKQVYLGN